MNIVKRALGSLAFVCLTLSGAYATATTPEYLYVLESPNKLVSYSVNSSTAKPTLLGHVLLVASPSNGSIQIVHNPATPYLYVIGFVSPTSEFIWTYSIDSKGLVGAKPIQTLPVKNALIGFAVQPNGEFAYALYSWGAESDGNPTYYADITLFTIKDGLLTNTKKAIVNFPANEGYWTYLLKFSPDGTKLITGALCEPCMDALVYYNYSTVNSKTGALGKSTMFWSDDITHNGALGYSAFGKEVIAQPNSIGSPDLIAFFTEGTDPKAVFNCTSKMAQVCGDYLYQEVFDPTGKYLFVSDGTTNTTPILEVNSTHTSVKELTNYLPGYVFPQFSRDGKIVYAYNNSDAVLIHTFNPANGEFGENYSLTVPVGTSIIPW